MIKLPTGTTSLNAYDLFLPRFVTSLSDVLLLLYSSPTIRHFSHRPMLFNVIVDIKLIHHVLSFHIILMLLGLNHNCRRFRKDSVLRSECVKDPVHERCYVFHLVFKQIKQ